MEDTPGPLVGGAGAHELAAGGGGAGGVADRLARERLAAEGAQQAGPPHLAPPAAGPGQNWHAHQALTPQQTQGTKKGGRNCECVNDGTVFSSTAELHDHGALVFLD